MTIVTKMSSTLVFWGYFSIFNINLVSSQLSFNPTLNNNVQDAVQFLREFDREAAEMCNRVANIEWKFATNSTDYNKRRMKEQQSIAIKFECLSWRRATDFDVVRISDSNVQRQLERITRQGRCGLADDKYLELIHIIAQMKDNYNDVKLCPFRGESLELLSQVNTNISTKTANYVTSYTGYCDLKLDPDITRIMEKSRSEAELRYTWTMWREKTGPPVKNTFMRYIESANQAAQLHGFKDAGEQMRAAYEDSDFFFTVQELWMRIQPLYKQLFTYVRRGLYQRYGEHALRRDGPIPAHLLGNMWAQNWRNILDIIKQEPNETPDVTREMVRQGVSIQRIFQMSEEFFTSLGLPPMSPEFWRNSMLHKPNDLHTQCTPSAWDFCNNIDFRIKQCTHVTIEDLINSHYEMTHIQYYMHYSAQPFVYREAPNPAFHEAVAHAIGLSVGGPVHLQKLGLLPQQITVTSGNSKINIEYLLNIALDKLPFMAFSLTLEKWRWHIFEKGPIGMNARWWELRLRYQGIIPPVHRNSEHFDPGSKYHIISDQDYIKYFVATILQFQIYVELCDAANHEGPLHTCDFYRSREAGRILSDIMHRGASSTPAQLLKILTRGKTSRLSAEPLLEFFRPLEAWLELQNQNEPIIGWNSNMNDVHLFSPLLGRANGIGMSPDMFVVLCTAMLTFTHILAT